MKPFFGLESSQSRHRLVRALIDALLVVVPTYILATFGAALSDTVIPSWLKCSMLQIPKNSFRC